MKLENAKYEEKINFENEEVRCADYEIFKFVEDGDIQGLNEYLMREYMNQLRNAS